jgi:hypothetical protein
MNEMPRVLDCRSRKSHLPEKYRLDGWLALLAGETFRTDLEGSQAA